MSAGLPSTIQVIASGPDYREHKASGTCPCGPVIGHDINEPVRLVFIHRRQLVPSERDIGAVRPKFGGAR